jgi:AcrR family transcriptional regulator
MRKLGQRLGVEAMSLYNHVANKDDLLDGLIEAVLGEIEVPVSGDDWKDGMRRRAVSAREVFRRHPWAMGILESRPQNQSPQRLGYYDAVLGVLRAAGFDSRLAMRAFSLVDAYIYGFILQEHGLAFGDDDSLQEVGADLMQQMAEAYPHLTAVTAEALAGGYDFADEFGFGLEVILGALESLRDHSDG